MDSCVSNARFSAFEIRLKSASTLNLKQELHAASPVSPEPGSLCSKRPVPSGLSGVPHPTQHGLHLGSALSPPTAGSPTDGSPSQTVSGDRQNQRGINTFGSLNKSRNKCQGESVASWGMEAFPRTHTGNQQKPSWMVGLEAETEPLHSTCTL